MKAGDRVVVKKSSYEKYLRGKSGVLTFARDGYGIILDEFIPGCHNLDGACEDGYGWYIEPEELELQLDKVTGVLEIGDI